MDPIKEIERVALPGTVIPKPHTKTHIIERWGQSRGERALVYSIKGNNEKRIRESDFKLAYQQLVKQGVFTREWFKTNLPDCNKDGGCNFTTLGGIFVLLSIAQFTEAGTYRLESDPK